MKLKIPKYKLIKKMKNKTYTPTNFMIPNEGILVHTKIDDEYGERNHQIMKLENGKWITKDGFLVQYQPTHWAYAETEELEPVKEDLWYC